MSTATMARPGAGGRSFYTAMAVLTALIVAAGFGPSYAQAIKGLPVWVHIHGALMTVWIALFAAQAWLAGRRSLALHRRLGWLSTGLVAAIVPLGLATSMLAVARHATPPFFTDAQMLSADLVDILVFAGLFAAAVVLRRQADWHKRLLLCATVLLTWPALGRMTAMAGLSLNLVIPAATLILFVVALAGPAFDAVTRRRGHPAYAVGVAAIVIAQPLHGLIAGSAPMQALAMRLAG